MIILKPILIIEQTSLKDDFIGEYSEIERIQIIYHGAIGGSKRLLELRHIVAKRVLRDT